MPREFLNKNVTVVGLGLHGGGVGTIRWLLREGARVLVTDIAKPERLLPSILLLQKAGCRASRRLRFVLGRAHRKEDIVGSQLVVINPDVPRSSPVFRWAENEGIPIRIGDTSLFIERSKRRIIGVTGTRGKTTTTALIGSILRRSDPRAIVAGNLRVSPLDYLRGKELDGWAALELSSWQVEGLDNIRRSPNIAVITNILPDHRNRYRSMEEYYRAKCGISRYQQRGDVLVLNRDNRILRDAGCQTRGAVWWASRRTLPNHLNGAYESRGRVFFQRDGRALPVCSASSIKLLGAFQIENVLCAVAATLVAGIPIQTIRAGISQFRGVSGRLERIRLLHRVSYYNDTAATSPEATIGALQTLSKRHSGIMIILGGADKGLEYSQLMDMALRQCRSIVFLPGSATEKMICVLPPRARQSFAVVSSMNEAVREASSRASPGDAVLLSPAAASFGLFLHAYDRGEQFANAVDELR